MKTFSCLTASLLCGLVLLCALFGCTPDSGTESQEGEGPDPNDMALVLPGEPEREGPTPLERGFTGPTPANGTRLFG